MPSPLLDRLWIHARDALQRLRATIPPLNTLFGRELREMRLWLRALEAMVRASVLLQAMSIEVAPRPVLAPDPALALARKQDAAPPKRKRPPPRLRLWPYPKPRPRMRLLGAPVLVAEIWRERRRVAQVAQLAAARAKRKPAYIRLADRLDAIERLLAAPLRAARRLARKLVHAPRLKQMLAIRFHPRSPHVDIDLVRELQRVLWAAAVADTS